MFVDIIRAWRDRAYRNTLSAEDRAALPEHPAGTIDLVDLTETERASVQGGGTDPTDGSECQTPPDTEGCNISDNCPSAGCWTDGCGGFTSTCTEGCTEGCISVFCPTEGCGV